MGTAFLGLIEREYKDVEQARATEEQEEEIAEDATFGQSVQKCRLTTEYENLFRHAQVMQSKCASLLADTQICI